ncbi:MAG: 6-phosphogluconolactonase [Deltaproteobacteria bacterium]|nr:6-phosphogluconolactonase [Deltaproteobacteria bacterium]
MSEVVVVRDAAEGAHIAAELFVEITSGAAIARGTASAALTGGSSAVPLYTALRSDEWIRRVPWDALQLFTGDERAVPMDDARSNAGVAARELLAHAPMDVARFHRMKGEAPDLAAEAKRCAQELRQTLGTRDALPRFDLVLLGLGSDGHVLSLFAGVNSSAERGDRELVRAVEAPLVVEPKVARISLVPMLLLNARCIVLHTMGAAKAPVLKRALTGPEDLIACPAQWLRRASGRVVIIADEAAAQGL